MPTVPYFLDDGTQVPGVTTVLGKVTFVPSDALCGWASKLAKEGKNWRTERNAAGACGTRIHGVIESYPVLPVRDPQDSDRDWTRIVAAYQNHAEWWEYNRPTIVLQEVPMVSAALRAGGCPDLVVRMKGATVLLDHKSSKNVKDGKATAQVAAYAAILQEVAGIKVDSAIIMHHNHDLKLDPVPVPADALKAGLRVFQIARELYDLLPQVAL